MKTPGRLVAVLLVIAGLLEAEPSRAEGVAGVVTLTDALARARSVAPAARRARATTLVAEAGEAVAGARRWPSVTMQLASNVFSSRGLVFANGVSTTAAAQDVVYGSGTLNASWTLYDFGKISAAKDAARHGTVQSEFDSRAVEQTAMLAVAEVYIEATMTRDEVAIARSGVESREQILRVTESQVGAGLRNVFDATRARIDVEAMRSDLATAESKWVVARTRLAALLDPDGPPREDVDTEWPSFSAALPEGIEGSPEVASARARRESLARSMDEARAARYPTLAATATASGNAVSMGEGTSLSRVGSAGLTLSMPILDAQISASIKLGESRHEEAAAAAHETSARVTTEARALATMIARTQLVITAADQLLARTEEHLAIVKARYVAGIIGPLELYDAFTLERQARMRVLGARGDHAMAHVRYLATVGRLGAGAGAR